MDDRVLGKAALIHVQFESIHPFPRREDAGQALDHAGAGRRWLLVEPLLYARCTLSNPGGLLCLLSEMSGLPFSLLCIGC